jgi:predicted nucleic acid-binding protein
VERAPQTLVLDASVAVKWFMNEKDTDKALLLREAHIARTLDLIAPDLIVYEVINTLCQYPKIDDKLLDGNIRSFFGMELDLIPPSSEPTTTIGLEAKHLRLSAYDSAYLSLAEFIGTYLVTADEKFHKRIRTLRKSLLLEELGEIWELP